MQIYRPTRGGGYARTLHTRTHVEIYNDLCDQRGRYDVRAGNNVWTMSNRYTQYHIIIIIILSRTILCARGPRCK